MNTIIRIDNDEFAKLNEVMKTVPSYLRTENIIRLDENCVAARHNECWISVYFNWRKWNSNKETQALRPKVTL